MRTPQLAILWELWRTSRLELLTRLGFMVFLVVSMLVIARTRGMSEGEQTVVAGLTIPLLFVSALFSSAWMGQFDNQQSGFSYRLGFTRPVATTWLVVLPMAYSIATSLLCYVVPALIFSRGCGVSIAIHGPAAIICAFLSCLLAAVWAPRTRVVRALSLGIVVAGLAGLLWWRVACYTSDEPLVMVLGRPAFLNWSLLNDLACLLIVGISTRVAIAGVNRQRHVLGAFDLSRFKLDVPARASADRGLMRSTAGRTGLLRQRIFRTPLRAQIWYELRACLPSMLIGGVIVPLICVLILCVSKSNDGHNHHPVVWLIAIVASPLICQFIGAEGASKLKRRQGTVELSSFDAIRPYRNDQLILIKLLTIAAGTIISMTCVGGAALVHYLLTSRQAEWCTLAGAIVQPFANVATIDAILGLASFALSLFCASSMLLVVAYWMAIYSGRLSALLYFGVLHIFVAAIDAHFGWPCLPLWITWGYLVAVLVVVASVLAVAKAVTSGSIGKWYLTTISVLWLCSLAAGLRIVAQLHSPLAIPPVLIILAAAFALSPLATATLAPLALASQRHR